MMPQTSTIVSCPTCNKKQSWSDSKPWSPFCCERCKLIDLGDWASEKHKIKTPLTSSSDQYNDK